ncbi:M28 family metallopeptidase [Peredibacter sp. HCB2-198]|uniref:M28 family metallopeptidase n=1 Tax=Peredibacter sp. HCB2-198 TaxID=3383025 RepID=UPI0038B510B0
MFRKLIIPAIFSLSFSAFAGRAPSTYFQLKSDLQQVSNKNLVEWVNTFVKASAPSRMVGMPGHEKARNYLLETIEKLDPKKTGKLSMNSVSPEVDTVKKFYQKDFDEKVEGKIPKGSPDYMKWQKFTAYMQNLANSQKNNQVENIVWEKPGINTHRVLVVTAHYDTISHDPKTLLVKSNEAMPGANYNASGVAVALGLIKTMAQFDLNYSVQVVFLDWQGIGFHGSELYARELKKNGKEVLGVVNLEMLGQDSSFFDKTKKTGNMSIYLRDNADEARWVSKLLEHGKKITTKVTFEAKPNGFENSDNFRFWEQGFMSATFSQNWEDDFNPKFYQTAQDTPETLNHETLWHAYQYVGGAVIGTLLDLTK